MRPLTGALPNDHDTRFRARPAQVIGAALRAVYAPPPDDGFAREAFDRLAARDGDARRA